MSRIVVLAGSMLMFYQRRVSLIAYIHLLNFFQLEDAGMVLVRGVKDKGDVKKTGALKEAYDLGLSIK